MDPDQTARMRRLVWIHAGRKATMLVFPWHGSVMIVYLIKNLLSFKSDYCLDVCALNGMLKDINDSMVFKLCFIHLLERYVMYLL